MVFIWTVIWPHEKSGAANVSVLITTYRCCLLDTVCEGLATKRGLESSGLSVDYVLQLIIICFGWKMMSRVEKSLQAFQMSINVVEKKEKPANMHILIMSTNLLSCTTKCFMVQFHICLVWRKTAGKKGCFIWNSVSEVLICSLVAGEPAVAGVLLTLHSCYSCCVPFQSETQEHLTLITGMSHVSRNVKTKELETSDRCHWIKDAGQVSVHCMVRREEEFYIPKFGSFVRVIDRIVSPPAPWSLVVCLVKRSNKV